MTAEPVVNAVQHSPPCAPVERVVELLASGCPVEVHDGGPQPPGGLTARPAGAHTPGRGTAAACR
ncbi:hypothetical protein [Streptomyces yangpuensis]|uniref:hypothetical protein n=1 Tax=Streptomyces yangpuensis TaxID=1648182 RepID=UPI00356928A6